MDLIPVSIVITVKGVMVMVNKATLQLLEAESEAQLYGQLVADFVHPLDQSRSQSRLNRKPDDWVNLPSKFRIRTTKNNFRMLLVSSRSIRYQGEDAVLLSGMDMTEQNVMEEHLRQSEMDFRRLFENMQDVYFRTDVNGDIQKISPAARRMLGYEINEIEGKPAKLFYLKMSDSEDFRAAILRSGIVTDFPGKMLCKNGTTIDISINSQALYDEEGQFAGVEGIFRDVTQRNAMERELKRLATTDPLTGIDNRRAFLEHAEHIFKSCQRYQNPMCLLMLDLDLFKAVNDQHGHLTGDHVLIRFAEEVKCELREIDLFGRLGGEEFCVLLQQTDLHQAMLVAERIRLRIQHMKLYTDKQEDFSLTVSIGIAMNRATDERLERVLDRADKALYQAKGQGRNQSVYET
jgi:diguanylate cyclase (GGDEF)-like protein/PAS domain S-box-containing protein